MGANSRYEPNVQSEECSKGITDNGVTASIQVPVKVD